MIDDLKLERFDLMGEEDGGALCIAYAADHPGQIGRLVLWAPFVNGSDLGSSEAGRSIVELVRANWPLARRAMADICFPSGPLEWQQWSSNYFREAASNEVAAKHLEFVMSLDVRAFASRVQAPTLVLHRRLQRVVPIAAARAAAALIPEARFVTLEGDWGTPAGDPSQLLAAIRNFLDEADAESEPDEPQPATGLAPAAIGGAGRRVAVGDRDLVEPRIQYAKTSDGVSIAYAMKGEGPPLVMLLGAPTGHVQRAWEMFPNIMLGSFRLILFDPRGAGLSDRDEIDFSMEAMMRDFEAVVDRAGLQSFAVLAIQDTVPIAVTYAATFPDRVSHLILIDGWTSWSDIDSTPTWEAEQALIDQDWTLFTETLARVLLGFDNPQVIEGLGEYIRACIEPEAYRAFVAAMQSWDVADLLANVKAQTLVLHNNHILRVPMRAGQKLAAGIPDARFLTIDDINYQHVGPLVENFAGTLRKA